MESTSKYALVTGASSGIGWHLAEELAKKDYSIAAVSNQPERLDELKSKLEKEYGISVLTFNIDLSREDAALKVFNFYNEKNLKIEVLINNAGTFIFGEAVRADYAGIKELIFLNTVTPVLLCRLFGEQMINYRKGFILNVSSITAVMSYPGISLYGPAKRFLRSYTRALRTEMKLYGVNVTCLIPGATDTGLYDTGKYRLRLLKLGIMKKPDVVAKAGVRALFKNRSLCIPGVLNKLIIFLMPAVPHFIISFVNRRTRLV